VTTIYKIDHVHTHRDPSSAAGLVPSLQQRIMLHQMMQSQHGTAHSSYPQQVQSATVQPTSSTPIHPPGSQQYDTSFPALPDHNETPWTKMEYKKRPRDTSDTHTQNTKQLTLNDYWLNQPSSSNANKFAVLMDSQMDNTQPTTPKPPPDHLRYLWQEFKTYSHLVNFSLRSQRTLLSLKCSKATK
jgi:hypothetical protein